MAAGPFGREESPDSTRQRCRVTPGGGNPRESATENRPPCNPRLRIARVRVKRWGKSPPRDWQQDRHGKPHREQCRIGIARGDRSGRKLLDTACRAALAWRSGLAARRVSVTARLEEWSSSPARDGQNPAYRPSAHNFRLGRSNSGANLHDLTLFTFMARAKIALCRTNGTKMNAGVGPN